jgi:hypothetical protein
VIKENLLIQTDQTPTFMENTQIFSLPIFYQILFLFTIIKTILSTTYFILIVGDWYNLNMSLIFIQITTAFLLTQEDIIIKIKNKRFKKLNESLLTKVFKITYVAAFCLEENMTMYYHEHFILNLNPGFIFFILLLILFLDLKTMKSFNEVLFYLYITNVVLLLYFLSLRNLMNFFLPVNLVLAMFILLNIVSQAFNKKLIKMELYHNFFENLISSIFKINDMYVLHDKKVLFHESETEFNENTSNHLSTIDNMDDQSIFTEYSITETKQETDMKRVPISNLKGFELVYKDLNYNSKFVYFNKNEIVNFLNLLFYLKNDNSNLNNDKTYMSEVETIYTFSKNIIRNLKMKTLIDKNSLKTREKIITLINCFIIEAMCSNHKIQCDDILKECNNENNKIEFTFTKSFISRSECKSLKNILEELGNCLNFVIKQKEDKLIVDFTCISTKKECLTLKQQRSEEEFQLDDMDSIIIPQSPRNLLENS